MEDSELVQRLQEGDRRSFDLIYEKYHLQLYKNAWLISGNRMDAEDILQETFVTAWKHIRELKNRESLKAWLFRIMTREAFRAGKRGSKEIPDEFIEARADGQAAPAAGSKDFTEMISDHSEILGMLESLDLKHREVLVLFYFEEMSISEIAAATGCFEGTVKSRLNAARKKIRSGLGPQIRNFQLKETEAESNARYI